MTVTIDLNRVIGPKKYQVAKDVLSLLKTINPPSYDIDSHGNRLLNINYYSLVHSEEKVSNKGGSLEWIWSIRVTLNKVIVTAPPEYELLLLLLTY